MEWNCSLSRDKVISREGAAHTDMQMDIGVQWELGFHVGTVMFTNNPPRPSNGNARD